MSRSSDSKKARRAKRLARRTDPTASWSPDRPEVTIRTDPGEIAEVLGRAHASTAGLGLCPGMEIEHDDGTAECSLAEACTDPGGLHPNGASCTMAPGQDLAHRCGACR